MGVWGQELGPLVLPPDGWGAVAFTDDCLDLALRQAWLVVFPLAFLRDSLLKRHRLPNR
jgi:hypothetical protein